MTPVKNQLRQFIFGETVLSDGPLLTSEIEKLVSKGRELKESGEAPSQDKILAVFSLLAEAWSDPTYKKRLEAIDALSRNSALSMEFVKAVLEEFCKIITPEYLLDRVDGEFGSPDIQDKLISQRQDNIRLIVQPAGQVLHVGSGNVFLACIESLINGIITRNVNFLKMSTDDRDFPVIFAESIREFDREGVISRRLAVLWWRGGDAAIEKIFKQNMDRIIFWGGKESLKSWERDLGEAAVLIRHGPKISFGVVSKVGLASADLPNLTDNIALDIVIWEQKACNCPQMLFLEESIPDGDAKNFITSLSESLEKMNAIFSPGRRSDDEYVEVMKARELATAKHFVTGRPISVIGPRTFDWTIIFEEKGEAREFEPSPLNRTIIIKRYASLKTFSDLFKGYSFYLQTVGCCLDNSEVPEYAARLSRLGATRLCPFGGMAIPVAGTPHDGSFALRDLTRFTVVEC